MVIKVLNRTVRAMPVRPDKLGSRLEAFQRALPVLNTLRLCHRFGKGPDVHLTKLPSEIEQIIESFVFKAECEHYTYYNWERELACFECRCEPADHIDSGYSPIWDYVNGTVEMCKACEESEEGYWDDGCSNRCTSQTTKPCDSCISNPSYEDCEVACSAENRRKASEFASEANYWLEDHLKEREQWPRRISQEGDGAFAPLAKVCHTNSMGYRFADCGPAHARLLRAGGKLCKHTP